MSEGKKEFDFSNLADLALTPAEQACVQNLFQKARVNTDFWKETTQEFIENFVRCLKSAIPCNAVPSVVAAQAILESGWFSTDSLFGVKATKLQVAQGEGTEEKTEEVVNGTAIPTVGTFFETPSIQNNFANYYEYLARMKPNSNKYLPDNRTGMLVYLQEYPAYSTAGNDYVESVYGLITCEGLIAFDHI